MKSSPRTRVLLLTPQGGTETLESALKPLNVDVLRARNLRDARRCVHDQRIDVVVTDVSLPDGNWSDVLRCVVDGGDDTNVVVCTPVVDELLWSEVLWRGGYDVLVKPFRAEEARRVVEGARRSDFPAAWKPRRSEYAVH